MAKLTKRDIVVAISNQTGMVQHQVFDIVQRTLDKITDLSAAELGELRVSCGAPLDVYVEVPDDQGGFVRFYEVPEMIRLAAPLYVKLGVRNAPGIYPAGLHLAVTLIYVGSHFARATASPSTIADSGLPTPAIGLDSGDLWG